MKGCPMRVRSTLTCLTALLFAVTLCKPCAAQQDKVKAARERAIEFLKNKQKKAGNWDFKTHEVGITALCTIALIENGVPLRDPVIQKGYEYVKESSAGLKNTYDIALASVLLSRVGDRRDKAKVKSLAARLIAGQLESGGWTYTCPAVDPEVINDRTRLPKPKEGFGDNSCTQFAVLGLWVASRTGLDIDKSLVKVAKRFTNTQLEDGGWSYTAKVEGAAGAEPVKPASGPSMTGAGIFCLAVAQAAQLREIQKSGKKAERKEAKENKESPENESPEKEDTPSQTLLENPIFSRGLKRTGDFVKTIGNGSARYFMWSVERVGVLLGLEKLGDVDWFDRGSAALLASQRDDGGWPSAHVESDPDGLADTSFALLFLRKANLGSDISRLLEGEHEQKFTIIHRKDPVRFDTLEDAVAAAKAGETIRIDGDGPFKLGHLVIDKDLTIQAGFGYTPVFKYEIAKNRLGIKMKPETDPNGRDMITVNGGKVTLEGLRLQMDPPAFKQPVPWRAVAVLKGSLRVLNCGISEINKQGTVAVSLETDGQLVVRNSVLVGGRAGIEIVAKGKQSAVIDNTVVYSNGGVRAINDPKTKAPADISLSIINSVFQTKDVFLAPQLAGTLAIDSRMNAFQSDWIGLTLLSAPGTTKGRTWSGMANIYDVKNWIGAGGKPVSSVNDPATWAAFWKIAEPTSSKRVAAFTGLRQAGNFSHECHSQDWTLQLPPDAETDLQKSGVGINPYLCGPGAAYDQYRDTINYTEWLQGRLGLSHLEGAKPAKTTRIGSERTIDVARAE